VPVQQAAGEAVGERVRPVQRAGLALAAVGVILLTVCGRCAQSSACSSALYGKISMDISR
jgi:hypothetical protein